MYIYIIFVHTDVYKSSYTRDLWMECCILRSIFVKWPAPELRHWKKDIKSIRRNISQNTIFFVANWKKEEKKRVEKDREKNEKREKSMGRAKNEQLHNDHRPSPTEDLSRTSRAKMSPTIDISCLVFLHHLTLAAAVALALLRRTRGLRLHSRWSRSGEGKGEGWGG